MSGVALAEVRRRAAEALDSRSPQECARLARHILGEYPRDLASRRLLGLALLQCGDVEAALTELSWALETDPEDGGARIALAQAQAARGLKDIAAGELKRALEVGQDDPDVRQRAEAVSRDAGLPQAGSLTGVALGRLYLRGGLLAQALAQLGAIRAQGVPRPEVLLGLAEACWRLGQLSETESLCQELLQAHPDCLKAKLILADIWSGSGLADEARMLLAQARQLDPENRVAVSLYQHRPRERVHALPPLDTTSPEISPPPPVPVPAEPAAVAEEPVPLAPAATEDHEDAEPALHDRLEQIWESVPAAQPLEGATLAADFASARSQGELATAPADATIAGAGEVQPPAGKGQPAHERLLEILAQTTTPPSPSWAPPERPEAARLAMGEAPAADVMAEVAAVAPSPLAVDAVKLLRAALMRGWPTHLKEAPVATEASDAAVPGLVPAEALSTGAEWQFQAGAEMTAPAESEPSTQAASASPSDVAAEENGRAGRSSLIAEVAARLQERRQVEDSELEGLRALTARENGDAARLLGRALVSRGQYRDALEAFLKSPPAIVGRSRKKVAS